MKAQLTAKYLQFLTKKNKNQNAGFTLIELLVVIIIIGVLSAIALPSFLNQAAKARGAEAKSNVGAINRGQQSYWLQQESFTNTIADLGLSIPNTSQNFTYAAVPGSTTDIKTSVANQGISLKPDIKSYTGGTYYIAGAAGTPGTTEVILCEADNPGAAAAASPTAVPSSVANADTCAAGTKIVR